MANYSNLTAYIANQVYQNSHNLVTADMVKAALNQMVNSLGAGYQYMGVADLNTPSSSPDYKCFYVVSEAGTYTNFVDSNNDPLVVNDGEVAIFKWDSAWSKEVTGIPMASVSQNILNIGGVDRAYIYGISNHPKVNECIKELYIPGIDTSLIKKVSFYRSINIGGVYYSGITLVGDASAIIVNMRIQTLSQDVADAFIAHPLLSSNDTNDYYAVVDWSKINYGGNADYVCDVNANTNKLDFSPTIKNVLEGLFDVTSFNNGEMYASVSAAATAVPAGMHRGGVVLRFKNSQGITEIWENIKPSGGSFTSASSWKNIWKSVAELEEAINTTLSFSNNTQLNNIISELYIQNGDALNQNIDRAIFYKAFIIDAQHIRTGIQFVNKTTGVVYVNLYKDYATQAEAINATKETILTDGINYAVIDFSKIVGDSNISYTIDGAVLNGKVLDLNYSPTIRAHIEYNDLISSIAVNVNDVSYWQHQKNSVGADVLPVCETITPIRCKPGHHYLLECSDEFTSLENRYLYLHIYTGSSEKNIENDLGAQRIDDNKVQFITPDDAKYLKIALQHISAEYELTPAGAANSNIRLYDVTYHLICAFGNKLINYSYSGSNYANGMDIYGGLVFQGMSGGNIDIYSLNTKELLQSVPVSMPSGETGVQHFNSICFGEKDSAEDEFPILWISPEPGNKIVGLSITRSGNTFSFENRYEIVAPYVNTEYIGQPFFDFKSNRLIMQAYHKNTSQAEGSAYWYGNSGFFVAKFEDLREITNVTDYTTTRIKNVGRRLWAIQDGFVRGDELFVLIGIPNQRMVIACYNINRKDIVKEWDLREPQYGIGANEEPEGICQYDGELYVSTSHGLYKVIL